MLSHIAEGGKDQLRLVLTTSPDIIPAIEEFQLDHGIAVPSVRAVLPLLDLNAIPRLDLHSKISRCMETRLIQRIDKMAKTEEQKLRELLAQLLPAVLENEPVRRICCHLMARLPSLEDEYIEFLKRHPQLTESAPIEVHRHVWLTDSELFVKAILPVIETFVADEESILTDCHCTDDYLSTVSSKQRRKLPLVQRIVDFVGKNQLLYSWTVDTLASQYNDTGSQGVLTLRAALLMALHDADTQQKDNCHKLAWCIDACISAQSFENKRLGDVFMILRNAKNLGESSKFLAEPLALSVLCSTVADGVIACITKDTLVRSSPDMRLLCALLSLATDVRPLARDGKRAELDVKTNGSTREFLALLACCYAQYELAGALHKRDHQPAGELSTALLAAVSTNGVFWYILFFYSKRVPKCSFAARVLAESLSKVAPTLSHHQLQQFSVYVVQHFSDYAIYFSAIVDKASCSHLAPHLVRILLAHSTQLEDEELQFCLAKLRTLADDALTVQLNVYFGASIQ